MNPIDIGSQQTEDVNPNVRDHVGFHGEGAGYCPSLRN